MPESHRQQGEWTPERLSGWAAKIGPATEQIILKVLSSRQHPQQGYRSCLGILRLGKGYGEQRLERACQRALTYSTCTYKSVESILKNRMDQRPLEGEGEESEGRESGQQELPIPDDHDNIRGAHYYH